MGHVIFSVPLAVNNLTFNQLRLRTSTGPELLAHFPQFLANLFLSGREDELSEFFNTSVVGYF